MKINLNNMTLSYPKIVGFVRRVKSSFSLLLLALFVSQHSFALTGSPYTHDPSHIIKCGNKYYVFSTGGNIGTMSSPDLINWTAEKAAFSNFPVPSWIGNYVSGFTGGYWAPDCIFMNGRYYLYYCAASWGTPNCVVGVASSPTLDSKAANYKWTDLGMVAYANSNKMIDAIDPYAFRDTNKKVFLTYGGYNGGNAVGEVDTITGKYKTTPTKVASKGEGTAMMKKGNYYYFFEQHGSCCDGVNSTYYITCGRSTNPLGPYVDDKGVSLSTSYGVTVIKKSGKFIGPGHFGLLQENGIDFASFFYDDGDNGGSPTLGIGRLNMVNGWPQVSLDWIDNGEYSVVGSVSFKSWEANTSANSISQIASSSSNNAQKWTFTQQGNGTYTIAAQNGKVAGITGCTNTNGALLQLGSNAGSNCQKFMVERAVMGDYVFTPLNSTPTNAAKMLGVVGNATSNGAQIELRSYNGASSQRFIVAPFGSIVTAIEEEAPIHEERQGACYPNPFASQMTISQSDDFDYTFYNVTGSAVEEGKGNGQLKVGEGLPSGMYLLHIRSPKGNQVYKVSKQ
jgi:arabinan endo-1,5-alpha-L-arabinosidase